MTATEQQTTTLAWHFLKYGKLRDGATPPADGEWLQYDGKCAMCQSGLHASESILHALCYAPGSTICRVECADIQDTEDDKLVCRRRRILWHIDGAELLREFARWCALQVIDLWDAPDAVRRYLETGHESLRVGVWSATRAKGAARAVGAANAAGWAALESAAWDPWSAALSSARSAGCHSRRVSWDVEDGTGNTQNEKLTEMVESAKP